jgi:hypothetical protein
MNFQKSIFLLALLCCLSPFISTPFALLPGMILAQTVEHLLFLLQNPD